MTQFGANYAENAQGVRNFKKHFLKELHKVSCVYQEINVEDNNSGLVVKPGKTHISRKKITSR